MTAMPVFQVGAPPWPLGVYKHLLTNRKSLTNITFASPLTVACFPARRDLAALHLKNLVHPCWHLMNKLCQGFGLRLSNSISNTTHQCIHMGWSWISVNFRRKNRPQTFDDPKSSIFGGKYHGCFSRNLCKVGV